MYIFCLALFAAWMLPLHLPPWVSWHKEVLVFLALNFWVVGAFIRRFRIIGWRDPIFVPHSIVFPLTLIGVTAAQYGTGLIVFGGDGVVLVLYFFCVAVALCLGYRTTQQAELVKAIAITFLVGGVLSVGVALSQAFELWGDSFFIASLFGHRRPGANLTQTNHLATLLLFSWASLVFLHMKNLVGRFTLGFITIWLFLGVAVTESRTGLVSLSVLLGWCFIHRGSVCRRLPTVALIAGGMFYLASLVYWPKFLLWYWMDGAAGATASVSMAAGTRLDVWPQLWEAILLKPWFGWGLLNVPGAHNTVLHNYSQAEAFSYAHSVALDGAIGVGIPLTAIGFGALISWLKARLSSPRDPVTWYCLAVVWPLCVHSMLEFPFAYSFLLLPVVVLIGVIESRATGSSRLRLPAWMGATLVAVATAVGMAVTYEYLLIEEDFRVARFEALRIGQTDAEYRRPNVYLLTQLNSMLQATRTVPDVDMSADQLEMLRLTAMRFPWAAIQNRYALSLALNGDPTEALRQLKVMRAMHGARAFKAIQANWEELSQKKFPQLRSVHALIGP